MKLRFLVTICALAIISATPAAAAAESQAPVYYLSLGDSLAAGTQPGREFTNEGYADQLACSTRHLIRVPDGLSDEAAAATQIAFGTAWHMLFNRGGLRAGQVRASGAPRGR